MPLSIPVISSPIEAMIFDMDGVLWKSETPIGDLSAFFQSLDQHGIRYGFITNNATKTLATYQQKLQKFGVRVDKASIMNSGQATGFLLQQHFPNGGPIYVVGEQGLIDTLASMGFPHQDDPNLVPVAVVAGLDRGINYQKISQAATYIRDYGVPFYGTNADKTFPTPHGQVPGSGTIVTAVATASGKEAIMAGKPEPLLFTRMLEHLNTQPANTLVIGDRLETDILGGINAGCPTLLVLSGIAAKKDTDLLNIHPTLILDEIHDLLKYMHD